jgi:hypothetical protein
MPAIAKPRDTMKRWVRVTAIQIGGPEFWIGFGWHSTSSKL